MIRKIMAALGAVVLAVTGTACSSGTAVVRPPPVTVTAPAVTVTAPAVVPAVCLAALDKADKVMGTAGEAFNMTAEIMAAVVDLDASAIEAVNAKLDPLATRMSTEVDAYKTAREACRTAAGKP